VSGHSIYSTITTNIYVDTNQDNTDAVRDPILDELEAEEQARQKLIKRITKRDPNRSVKNLGLEELEAVWAQLKTDMAAELKPNPQVHFLSSFVLDFFALTILAWNN